MSDYMSSTGWIKVRGAKGSDGGQRNLNNGYAKVSKTSPSPTEPGWEYSGGSPVGMLWIEPNATSDNSTIPTGNDLSAYQSPALRYWDGSEWVELAGSGTGGSGIDFETVARNLGAKGVLKTWPYTTAGANGDFWVMGNVPVTDPYAHLRVFDFCSHIVAHYPDYGEDPVGYWGVYEDGGGASYYDASSREFTVEFGFTGEVKGRPCVDFDGTLYLATDTGVVSCTIDGSEMSYTSATDVIGVAVNMTDVGHHVFVAHSKAQGNGRFLSVYGKDGTQQQITTFNTPSAPTMVAGLFVKDGYRILVGHQTEIVRFTTSGTLSQFTVGGLSIPWRAVQAKGFVQPLPESASSPTSGWAWNSAGLARLAYNAITSDHVTAGITTLSGMSCMDSSRSNAFVVRGFAGGTEVASLTLIDTSILQANGFYYTNAFAKTNTFVQIDGFNFLSGQYPVAQYSFTSNDIPVVPVPPKKGDLIKWEGGAWVSKGPFDLLTQSSAGLTQAQADGRYLQKNPSEPQEAVGETALLSKDVVVFDREFPKAGISLGRNYSSAGKNDVNLWSLSTVFSGSVLSMSSTSTSVNSPNIYLGDSAVSSGVTAVNAGTIRPKCLWINESDASLSVGGRFKGSSVALTSSTANATTVNEDSVNGALYVRPGTFTGIGAGNRSATCSLAVSQSGSVYINGNGTQNSINIAEGSLATATSGALYLRLNKTSGNLSGTTTLLREDLEQSVQDDLGYVARMRARDAGDSTRIAELEERVEKLETVVRLQLEALEALVGEADDG